MKLRIRGNSLRFRLGRGEVRALVEAGAVEEHTLLGTDPNDRLVHRIALSETASSPSVRWRDGHLDLMLPAAVARAWASGDHLSLDASLPVAGGETLHVLVEKDLACLQPRPGEDDADAYPNPKASSGEPIQATRGPR